MVNWTVAQEGSEPEKCGHWGSVFTISNGYFGTRGVDDESTSGEPSTYIAGTFTEDFIGVDALPNTPNWLLTELEIDGERFDLEKHKLLDYRREYNLREGVLYRSLRYENSNGGIRTASPRQRASVRAAAASRPPPAPCARAWACTSAQSDCERPCASAIRSSSSSPNSGDFSTAARARASCRSARTLSP